MSSVLVADKMTNVLVVESKNDEVFLKTLIEYLNLSHVRFHESPICNINKFECMEGLDKTRLIGSLKALRRNVPQEMIRTIGIVLDHDGKPHERMNLINESIDAVFAPKEPIAKPGEFISAEIKIGNNEVYPLKIACHLIGVGDGGELETLLKLIKSKDSTYADCLEGWKRCLEEQQKVLSEKEYVKFWLNNYVRFDTCSDQEKKQAGRKCSTQAFAYVMENKRDAFDFDHPALDDLKAFLRLFSS